MHGVKEETAVIKRSSNWYFQKNKTRHQVFLVQLKVRALDSQNGFGWCPVNRCLCCPYLWCRDNDQMPPTYVNEPVLTMKEWMPGWDLGKVGQKVLDKNKEVLAGSFLSTGLSCLHWSPLPSRGQPWGQSQAKKATLQNEWMFLMHAFIFARIREYSSCGCLPHTQGFSSSYQWTTEHAGPATPIPQFLSVTWHFLIIYQALTLFLFIYLFTCLLSVLSSPDVMGGRRAEQGLDCILLSTVVGQ